VDLAVLNDSEKVAFFLNVYQCMYIHFFLKQQMGSANEEEQEKSNGWLS
jgi:hypothetical protein